MYRGTIISLCDLTGIMVKPWVESGYRAVLVDPQHKEQSNQGGVERLPFTILDAMPRLSEIIKNESVVFVFGFPPCTDVAVSGARWFEDKRNKDQYFQAKAALVAEQCRMIGLCAGAPWGFENPVSIFSGVFGKPGYSFHPYEFAGHCSYDNYTKKTCIWSGNGFIMPEPLINESLGKPDNRIHTCPPSAERANIRSATPRGFAKAVYLANAPHLKKNIKSA